jgi:hypothetical protein
VHILPLESNLEALCLAIVSQAPNASILNGVVFDRKRVEKLFAIDDPMPKRAHQCE